MPETRSKSKKAGNEQSENDIKFDKMDDDISTDDDISDSDKEVNDGENGVDGQGDDNLLVSSQEQDLQDGVKAKSGEVESNEVKTQQRDCINTQLKHNPLCLYGVAFAIVIVYIIVFIASIFLSEQDNETNTTDVTSKLDRLFKDFKNQSPRSAKKLRNRVLPYLNHTRSPQPFVLMVAAMQEDELAGNCFATRVGKIINSKPLLINASSYLNVTGEQAKHDIDGKIRAVFQEGEFPTAAIIYNLDLLPYSTLDLFYSFCDHDNPLYKEATIIFTVMLPPEYNSMSSTSDDTTSDDVKREGIVETYLQDEWSKDEKFDENVIGALLSRISDTVIVVSGESKESVEKLCS